MKIEYDDVAIPADYTVVDGIVEMTFRACRSHHQLLMAFCSRFYKRPASPKPVSVSAAYIHYRVRRDIRNTNSAHASHANTQDPLAFDQPPGLAHALSMFQQVSGHPEDAGHCDVAKGPGMEDTAPEQKHQTPLAGTHLAASALHAILINGSPLSTSALSSIHTNRADQEPKSDLLIVLLTGEPQQHYMVLHTRIVAPGATVPAGIVRGSSIEAVDPHSEIVETVDVRGVIVEGDLFDGIDR